MTKTLAERFAEKVNTNGPTPTHRPELVPCHVWLGAPRPDGYGEISINNKSRLTHRVAFFLAEGRWPEPCALHHCDNAPCVKARADEFGPAHLFEGCSRPWSRRAKLTDAIVADMRASPLSTRHFSRELGLSRATIRAARDGKTWKHVATKQEEAVAP